MHLAGRSISFALATKCRLLVLDEPTNGLDIPSKAIFRKIMAGSLDEDQLVLISTHQVKDVEMLIDRIVILDNGRIVLDKQRHEISSRLRFGNMHALEAKGILYSETAPGGYKVITEEVNGDSAVDIELLFMQLHREKKYSKAMQTDNFFNIARFGVLCRQTVIHHYRLALAACVAYCGGLFILLLVIQFMEGFQPVAQKRFLTLFLITFAASGIICAGTAFPNFRSREKMHSYLMIPASSFEKFLMEVIGRILLFILVVPLLYWMVHNAEACFVKLFYPPFSFQGSIVFSDLFHAATETLSNRLRIFSFTGGLLIFITAFTGATIFSRNPVVKTLFSVALIFFFNLSLAYFFFRGLGFGEYHTDGPILGMRHTEDLVLGTILVCLIFNAGFLAAAYFKVKEREV